MKQIDYSRRPLLADGILYPETQEKREELFKLWESKPVTPIPNLKALWVPHAGWAYTGEMTYRALLAAGGSYSAIIIIAPTHNPDTEGLFAAEYKTYETPGGILELGNPRPWIEGVKGATTDDLRHEEEQAVEVLLPMVTRLWPDTPVIPLLAGENKRGESPSLVRFLKKRRDKLSEALIIFTGALSDLTIKELAKAQSEDLTALLAGTSSKEPPMPLGPKRGCGRRIALAIKESGIFNGAEVLETKELSPRGDTKRALIAGTLIYREEI